jgi:23S rRNA (uridine2552-2'-O)-methyltransferase
MAKRGRRRQDHLARRARGDGYRARSVYKLAEIDRKVGLFPAARVLDLGAAPGSWTQYALQRGAQVTAVDLNEINVGEALLVTGDFTEESTVRSVAENAPFDLVLSDAAPATTGNKIVDTAASEGLVESILASLPRWLERGGACVCKVFQGGGEQRLLRRFRDVFERARIVRPDAVRSESFEVYLVGLGFTGDEKAAPEGRP